jgi:hypothetical protein
VLLRLLRIRSCLRRASLHFRISMPTLIPGQHGPTASLLKRSVINQIADLPGRLATESALLVAKSFRQGSPLKTCSYAADSIVVEAAMEVTLRLPSPSSGTQVSLLVSFTTLLAGANPTHWLHAITIPLESICPAAVTLPPQSVPRPVYLLTALLMPTISIRLPAFIQSQITSLNSDRNSNQRSCRSCLHSM